MMGLQNATPYIIYPDESVFDPSSLPGSYGYFYTVQDLLYDDERQALYALVFINSPVFSQNMPLYFAVSGNNGQTWSEPYNVSGSSFANRGFSTMALDNGNLYLGWYDGRNDPNMKKIQYFGGIHSAKLLDRMVNKVPRSNPTYSNYQVKRIANTGHPL